MPIVVPRLGPLLIHATQALGATYRDLAEMLGVSERTVGRWMSRGGGLSSEQVARLAVLVHPRDPELAAKLAVEAGTSLEKLGLVVSASAEALARMRPFPPIGLVVDSVVHAAVEAQRDDPDVRAVLRAAFERARGIGLTVDEVCQALHR